MRGFQSSSELSPQEQTKVQHSKWTPDKYAIAYRLLTDSSSFLGFPAPNDDDVEMAAKVISALPANRIPKAADGTEDIHPTWLLTEAWILQGRDPMPIHLAALFAWTKARGQV